jgi:hypothetical protein
LNAARTRDLGLAVADVAADHAVHRDGLLHVGLDLGDRGELVDGLGESERVLHLGLPRGVRAERIARRRLTFGVERDQFVGDLADRAAGLGLGVDPVAAAEPAQRRGLAADVTRQLVQRIHRDVELVGTAAAPAGRVLEHQIFAPGAPDRTFHHLDEPADPVLVVDHQVASGKCQRVDHIAALGGQPLALCDGDAAAGQVAFRDDDQVHARQHDAVVQRAAQHADHPQPRSLAGLQAGGRDIGLAELFDDTVRGPGSGCDDGCVTAGRDLRTQHREDLLDAVLMSARRRRRSNVELDRAAVTQLAQRPPRMAAVGRRGAHVVQLVVSRLAERFNVDGNVTTDGGRRP